MNRLKNARRTAAGLALATVASGAAVLNSGPAHAGMYCTVIPQEAPVFEHPDPASRIVGRLSAGVTVAASRTNSWEMFRVACAGDHLFPGHMKPYHLDCGNVG